MSNHRDFLQAINANLRSHTWKRGAASVQQPVVTKTPSITDPGTYELRIRAANAAILALREQKIAAKRAARKADATSWETFSF